MIEFGEDEYVEVINRLFGSLGEYLLAHILISRKFFIRTHGETGEYTHGHLRGFTHMEVRKRTILN